jgi:replicative DNA helicase
MIGMGAHLFSLEDSPRAVAQRMMARTSGLSTDALRRFNLSVAQLSNLADAVDELALRPNWLIDFRPGLTMREVRRSVERHIVANKTKVVALDYINKVGCDDLRLRHDRRLIIDQAMDEASQMAKELDVCVLVGAQLKRKDYGDDRRPTENDFAESDKILRESKLTLGFYRGEYGDFDPVEGVDYEDGGIAPSLDEFKTMAQFIIIKQNNGQTGTVHANWNGETVRVW